MDVLELMKAEEEATLAEAVRAVAWLEHYERDGEDLARARLGALYRLVEDAVRTRDLQALVAHAGRIASERHAAGYRRVEVLSAFAALMVPIHLAAPLQIVSFGLIRTAGDRRQPRFRLPPQTLKYILQVTAITHKTNVHKHLQVLYYSLETPPQKRWTKSHLSCKITNRNQARSCWRKALANIKSQIKRNKQNEKRRLRNRYFIGRARTYVKSARSNVNTGGAEDARLATLEAISELDRAAQKGVIHKNNAARRKSRLMKQLNTLEKQAS